MNIIPEQEVITYPESIVEEPIEEADNNIDTDEILKDIPPPPEYPGTRRSLTQQQIISPKNLNMLKKN